MSQETQNILVKVLQEVQDSRKETQQWRETLVTYIAKNDEKMDRITDTLNSVTNDWWGKDGRLGGKAEITKMVDSEKDRKIYRGVVATTILGLVGERAFHLFFK